MPKYYIKSGHIKFIIDRNNPDIAIIDTLKFYQGKNIIRAPKICIGESGFDSFKKWKCFDINDYLKKVK
jgi:hypothetical protein